MARTCSTCRYFQVDKENELVGECHCHTPLSHSMNTSYWPRVDANNCCGEWELVPVEGEQFCPLTKGVCRGGKGCALWYIGDSSNAPRCAILVIAGELEDISAELKGIKSSYDVANEMGGP